MRTYAELVAGAMLSPLAGHAMNPSMGLDGGIHAALRPHHRRGHRTRQGVRVAMEIQGRLRPLGGERSRS
ncbi:hypothetical protein DGM98_02320 [Xanthomonas citri]|nr:hypothetical protein DGM98_02320 [Xanthomonas citri]SON93353.1 exported hypothetical protein [Xanthomonas citri pv. fuscans]